MRSIFYSAFALLGMSRVDLSPLSDSWARFEKYVEKFNKTYADNGEIKHRFMAFLENEEEIAELNALEGRAIFGWTKFSDMTKEEFSKRLNFVRYDKDRRSALFGEIPVHKSKKKLTVSSLDWRTKNAVTPVKNQGKCGSCWAFSAVQAVESAYLLKHRNTSADNFLLSEQELVSCDSVDEGCNGGDLPSAFNFTHCWGLTTEKDYPYTSGDDGERGICKEFVSLPGTKLSSYKYATPGCENLSSCDNQDEGTLANTMMEVGPVAININANTWMNYRGGIMSAKSCGSHDYIFQNHCAQAVGFESIDSESGYWIVKNSWASDWGDDGYIYLKYGENTCGLADEAYFVIL